MKNYRKFIKIFLPIFLTLQLLWFSEALAIDSTYKIWMPQKENVAADKNWNIKFNYSLNESTLYKNIKVIELGTKESIEIDVTYNEDNKSISVKPKRYYDYGQEYMLIIENELESSEGLKLKQGIKFNFSVESLEKDNPNLLQEVFSDPGTKINTPEQYYNALRHALANFKSEVTLNISNYNSEDYGLQVANKVLSDNPILNYGYRGARASVSSYSSTGPATMEITFNYDFSKEKMEFMKKASEEKAREIVNKVIKPGMSDFQKELALHDYIVNNARYDTRLYSDSMPNESYLDYGVLIEGLGVCDSYARAMYRLLNMVGVECIYVTGDGVTGGEIIPHAWNIVKIEGKYYQLDATWNDPVLSGGGNELRYTYFNVTDTKLSQDHIWDKSNYPRSTDEKFKYLSDMNYPVINGDYIYYSSDFDNDKLYRIKVDGTEKTRILNERAVYITVYGEWIYFSNYSYGGNIYKIRIDGTGRTKLNNTHSINLRIEGGMLHYTDYNLNIDKTISI